MQVERRTRIYVEYDGAPATLCFHWADELGQNLRILQQTRRQLVKLGSTIGKLGVCPIKHSVVDGERGTNGSKTRRNRKWFIDDARVGRYVTPIVGHELAICDAVDTSHGFICGGVAIVH